MMTVRPAIRFLSSYSLACAVFVLLLLLTYLGTVGQIENGLLWAQQRYFYSWVVMEHIWGVVPIILPGGRLLLSVLFVNLLLGGVIQARKGWRQLGVIIAHVGILVLLLGGFIGEQYATRGFMRLYEGETAKVIQSNDQWELAITGLDKEGHWREFLVPDSSLARATDKETVYSHPLLPFDVLLNHYMPNARPRLGAGQSSTQTLDTVRLEEHPLDKNPQRNIPGVYLTALPKEGEKADLLAWGLEAAPAKVEAGGEAWLFGLRKKQWPLPFFLELEEFRREMHPGTSMPKAFSSRVVRRDETGDQPVIISMNQPLRHRGYTVYQSSWGPQNAPPGTPLFSVFEVASNPADRWPLYACIIIAAGMVIHFTLRLTLFMRANGGDKV